MQQPPKKNYYKLTPDAPTAADKKREADLAKALGKEDFYGKSAKKKAPAEVKAVSITVKSPLMRAAKSAKKQ